jgi:signal transduction histidine kinase
LIPDKERPALHLKIGRMMLSLEQGNTISSEKLFEIVSHFNSGRTLIYDLKEIELLSRLNLAAARRARESVAYEATVNYAMIGEELLYIVLHKEPDNQISNELLEYELLIGEGLYLQGQFNEADQVFDRALKKTSLATQRARIFVIRIYLYTNRSEYSRAVELAINGLAELGIDLQPAKIATEMIKLYKSANTKRNKRSIEEILALPELIDSEKRAAMDLLVASTGATYVANAELSQLVPLHMVNITLDHGNTASASHGYALFGMFLSAMQNYEAAYEYGRLGIALAEKYDRPDSSSKVYYIFSLAISHWKRPAFEGIEYLDRAYRYAIDSGDRIFAGFSRLTSCAIRSIVDLSIEELLEDSNSYLAHQQRMKHRDGELWMTAIRQRLLALKGKTFGWTDLSDSEVNESLLNQELMKSEMKSARMIYLVQKIMLLCLFHQFEEAISYCKVGREIAVFVSTQIMEVEFNFYDSLASTGALLASPDLASLGGEDRDTILARLAKNQKVMRRWSENCPENFLHKYNLIEAELASIIGEIGHAGMLYDESARLASQNGFLQDAALANERAALHFSKSGIKKAAVTYFRDAYEGFKQYGAITKAEHISELFSTTFPGQHIAANTSDSFSPFESSSISSTRWDEELDIRTVLKATTAISGEIILEKLQEKLLQTLIENAGAQRGVLLLERDGHFYVEADGKAGDNIEILKSISVEEGNLPTNILNYVVRTTQSLVISDGLKDNRFNKDTYITINKIRSILCMPIFKQGKINGILYLENNLITNAFTTDRLELLRMLSAQASISIENAKLYNNLEQKVEERTKELQVALEVVHDQKIQVESTLEELRETQEQLIHAEKFAALGQLVAGVAHEINNPIGAVQASAERIQAELEIGTKEFPEYFRNLKENEIHIFTELLDHALANKVVLTTKEERNRKKIIKQSLESLDFSSSENRSLALDFLSNLGITDRLEHYFNSLKEDSFLKTIYIVDRFVSQDKSLRNIYISVEKASKVVFSMRKFLNTNIKTEKKTISIREEIEKVIKVYDNYINGFIAVSFEANSDVSLLCHTEEMTQVWRNIIFNAIQAMYSTEKYLKISIVSDQGFDISKKKMVTIKFQDTGMGMTPEIKEKIYTPFFTTKPAGEGIGLGLFISRKIVEEHGGDISFTSEVGNTEFVVRLPI